MLRTFAFCSPEYKANVRFSFEANGRRNIIPKPLLEDPIPSGVTVSLLRDENFELSLNLCCSEPKIAYLNQYAQKGAYMNTEAQHQYSRWDIFFIKQARLIASMSKDPSTKTGAVIVRHNRTVCSMGFNGFPRTMPDSPVALSNREEKLSRIIHCEMNALLFAREPVVGYTLYTTGCCCDRCAVHMIQAGIYRFVFPEDTPGMKARWGASFERTKRYFEECGCLYTEIPLHVLQEQPVLANQGG